MIFATRFDNFIVFFILGPAVQGTGIIPAQVDQGTHRRHAGTVQARAGIAHIPSAFL